MTVKLDSETGASETQLDDAVSQIDAMLASGMVHISMAHPVLSDVMIDQFISRANYPSTRPGIASFVAAIKMGEISTVSHDDATLTDLVLVLFADLVDSKGKAFVVDSIAKIDKSAAKAQAAAKLSAWRDKLGKLKLDGKLVQTQAKALYKKEQTARAKLDLVLAAMDALKSNVATELSIDKIFDIAYISKGLYIPEDVKKTSGTRSKVVRVWDKDKYTATSKIDGHDYTAVATIKDRDPDDTSKGEWVVVYTCKGKKYSGKGSTLNSANRIARGKMIDVVAKDMSKASHAPKLFGVKVKK